ncbi:hypothetical protein COCSUDRAFT_34561 [Coccomyxa subellipsoidea C-169]|uniref:Uncharacterized protein n=1 Tax=Coccomyxa subellipsoidea (strain C-169) TaxID=574566 RepID=I0YJ36_COCSC|nr:hypothetical protein COCSUDRAFT_34561 [Coccomyxa subellipsoidea C-169]EIE18405.1 hypothetical protein COCSUDRAFT_34561 [Coccomyxa subellipsoidea C-169]|eukprot:XP_005642949.1 hypothetical protein COCSUDRAFT_34561 [Coccomyxa subellipsoidea C-169]
MDGIVQLRSVVEKARVMLSGGGGNGTCAGAFQSAHRDAPHAASPVSSPSASPLTSAQPAAQNTLFGETVWLFSVLLPLAMLGRAAFLFLLSMLHNWFSHEEEPPTLNGMIITW